MLKGKILRSLTGSRLDFITDESQRKLGLKAERVVDITSFTPRARGETKLTYVTVNGEPLVELSEQVGRYSSRTVLLSYVSDDPDELPFGSHINFRTFARRWGVTPNYLLRLILSNAPKKHLRR